MSRYFGKPDWYLSPMFGGLIVAPDRAYNPIVSPLGTASKNTRMRRSQLRAALGFDTLPVGLIRVHEVRGHGTFSESGIREG